VIVAVLGAGKIGEAVARKLADSGEFSRVVITKRNPHTLKDIRAPRLHLSPDNQQAAREADIIIIAVKAGDAKRVLDEILPFTAGKIVISLMAAISIQRLEKALPEARIVRSMPNIAAMIGEAITAYSPGKNLTKKDMDQVKSVLGSFGDHIEVPESLMNAVTALSGSGPAYIAVLIEAMVSAGLKVGIPREVAFKLVTKTLTGTADLLSKNGLHPAELRDLVTTPAGTTIAGIYELEKGALRTSIMNAVDAATQAAEKVAKKFENEE
jgi:pyrroline-5-carboxylate reductase